MNKFIVMKGCDKLKNADRIFPLKQAELINVVNVLKPYVNKIIVFGSSTNWNCNYKSDIDLVVEPNDKYNALFISKELSKVTLNGYDLFTVEQLKNADNTLKDEVEQNGVCIYE